MHEAYGNAQEAAKQAGIEFEIEKVNRNQ